MQVPRNQYSPVAPIGRPSVQGPSQVNPDAYGAGLAQGIENLGDQTFRAGAIQHREEVAIAEKATQEADQTAAEGASNTLEARQNKRLALAGQTRGQQAFDLPIKVNEDFDTDVSDLSATLTNDRQKALFARSAAGQRVASNRFVDNHVAQQAAAYRDETYDSGKAVTLETVGVHYADEGVVNATINAQVNKTEQYAAATGKPPEWLNAEHTAIVSSSHAEVVSRYLSDDNTKAASGYFDKYRDEMSAKDQEAVQRALSGANDIQKSQDTVDSLMLKPGDYNGGIGLQEGLDHIRDQYKDQKDPRSRQMAEQRWVTSYRQRENAYQAETSNIFSRSLATIADPKNPRGLDSVNLVDQSALLSRDPEAFDRLSKYSANKLRGVEPTTDRSVYAALTQMAARDPDQFAKAETLYSHINSLSSADWQHFADLQGSIIKAGRNSPTTQGLITQNDVAQQALHSVGIPWDVSNPDKADPRAQAFYWQLDKEIRANQATGTKLTPEQVKKITDRLLVKVAIPDPASTFGKVVSLGGYSPLAMFGVGVDGTKDVPAFEAPGADQMASSIQAVPPSYRSSVPPGWTEDQIIDAYNMDVKRSLNAGSK